MSTATMDTEELARLALGGRALKNRRVRRAIIARLINENGESYEGDESEEGDEEETTGGGSEGDVVRLLIGSRLLRHRRVRRALLAHLLRTKSESETEGEGEEDEGMETGEEGGEGRELVRALIASKLLRRRRVRRALLVHLLRTKAESMSEMDESEEDSGDEGGGGGGEDRELVRALIASKLLRRRRVRRALLTHLLSEKEEAVA